MTHPSKKAWTLGSAAPLFTESCISLYIFFWKSLFFSGKTFPGLRMAPSVKCSERLIVFTGPLTSVSVSSSFSFFPLFLRPCPSFNPLGLSFPNSPSLSLGRHPFSFFFTHPFYSWAPTSSAVTIPLVFIFLEAGCVLPRTSAAVLYALENWVGFLEVWKRLAGCSRWLVHLSQRQVSPAVLLTCCCDSQVTNPSEFIVNLECVLVVPV